MNLRLSFYPSGLLTVCLLLTLAPGLSAQNKLDAATEARNLANARARNIAAGVNPAVASVPGITDVPLNLLAGAKTAALQARVDANRRIGKIATASASLRGAFATATSLPETLDNRREFNLQVTLPIENQAGCGSCWIFAAVGSLSMANLKNNIGNEAKLSEQHLLQHLPNTTGQDPCSGGDPLVALQFLVSNGTYTDLDLPYDLTRRSVLSRAIGGPFKGIEADLIDDTVLIPNPNKIKAAIVKYGSVVSIMWAGNDLKSHNNRTNPFVHDETNRAFNPDGSPLKHAVVIVGWTKVGGVEHWIFRNSWGPNFGDNGYATIPMTGVSEFGSFAMYISAQPNGVIPENIDAGFNKEVLAAITQWELSHPNFVPKK